MPSTYDLLVRLVLHPNFRCFNPNGNDTSQNIEPSSSLVQLIFSPRKNNSLDAWRRFARSQEQCSFWRHFGRTVEFLPDEELGEMDLLEALSEAGRLG